MRSVYNFLDKWVPKEGRWFLGGSHVLLCLISVLFYGLQRSFTQIFLAYIFALGTEFVLFKMTDKYKGRSIWDRMFSAASEVAGLIILIRSAHVLFYGITGVLAVTSKYIFRLDEKRHLYNPTNFSIIAGLCLFPQTTFNLLTDEFTQSYYPLIHVLFFGTIAVWRGKTWQVTLGYAITMLLFASIVGTLLNGSFIYWLGPEIGAIGLIFMFLMITDPRTTPASAWGKFFFGVAVATMKICLKSLDIIYAHFIALFIVTVLRGTYHYGLMYLKRPRA